MINIRNLRPKMATYAGMMKPNTPGAKDIRLHDARHAHISIMLKRCIHPKIFQERLGQPSLQITLDTYSHLMPRLHQEVEDAFETAINPLVGVEWSKKLHKVRLAPSA